jgi:hypothetical protein
MTNNNRNDLLVSGAEAALEQMKLEVASELGIPNYNEIDKGDLPSRVNGQVGGQMTKRLVAMAQAQLAGQPQVTSSATEVDQDAKQNVEAYMIQNATHTTENSEYLQ